VTKIEDGTTRHYLYDGARVEAEYNNSWDLVFRYTLEGDSYYDPLLSIRVASDGETHFFLPDGLGSMRNLIHGDNISSSYSYDAFGNIMSANGNPANPYHYVGALGYYQDSTSGLLHVGARYYNPKVGRFWTRDPISYKFNSYDYAEENPTNYVDPNGLGPFSGMPLDEATRAGLQRGELEWQALGHGSQEYVECMMECMVMGIPQEIAKEAGAKAVEKGVEKYSWWKAVKYATGKALKYPQKSSIFRGIIQTGKVAGKMVGHCAGAIGYAWTAYDLYECDKYCYDKVIKQPSQINSGH